MTLEYVNKLRGSGVILFRKYTAILVIN